MLAWNVCCSASSRFGALIYQRMTKYMAGYIDSTFAGSERGMFLSEKDSWIHVLAAHSRLWSPKLYIDLLWGGKMKPD